MIQLTRLNNSRLAVNCDLIKYVEEAPDTVITLVNGEKLVVRETTEEVIERVREFRRSVWSARHRCRSAVLACGATMADVHADIARPVAGGPHRG